MICNPYLNLSTQDDAVSSLGRGGLLTFSLLSVQVFGIGEKEPTFPVVQACGTFRRYFLVSPFSSTSTSANSKDDLFS